MINRFKNKSSKVNIGILLVGFLAIISVILLKSVLIVTELNNAEVQSRKNMISLDFAYRFLSSVEAGKDIRETKNLIQVYSRKGEDIEKNILVFLKPILNSMKKDNTSNFSPWTALLLILSD